MRTARFEDYPFDIRPLSKDEGGGFLVTFPDLPGCMSDGETPEEALANAKEAFEAWTAAAKTWRRGIPKPFAGRGSGRFMARVPKSLHARLAARAQEEGVSLNTLVVSLLSERVERARGERKSRKAA